MRFLDLVHQDHEIRPAAHGFGQIARKLDPTPLLEIGSDPVIGPRYSEADVDEIAALVAQSQKRSAVFDIITNPTNVQVKFVKL